MDAKPNCLTKSKTKKADDKKEKITIIKKIPSNLLVLSKSLTLEEIANDLPKPSEYINKEHTTANNTNTSEELNITKKERSKKKK
jgi:hypothetical protein